MLEDPLSKMAFVLLSICDKILRILD